MALNLPLEMKLAESINRRRIAEELRKQRIFNPKQRQIGVDIEALNHQMHEHMLSKSRQSEIEKHFADELKRQDHLAELVHQREMEDNIELNKKIDEFRLTQQRPEYRRDYDLYDPNRLKKERPPRISDNEPCPVSGLQKFEGEDINYKDRSKKQKEQAKDLLLQQMQEKRMKNYMENKEATDWDSMLLNRDYNALQMAQAELDNFRKMCKELNDSNKYLAIETTERKMQQKLNDSNKYLAIETTERKMQQKFDDDYEKRKDIKNNFYSDLLTENPLVARSSFGSHRVVPDRWKGMSKQQLEEYYEGQIQQINDKKRNEEHEKYKTSKWNEIILNQANTAQLQKEEEQRQQVEMDKKLAMENLNLAQQQRIQQEYTNKILYSNIPSEGYFAQFNTTSR